MSGQYENPQVETVETEKTERIFVASQWQLMWWRFRRHKVAGYAAIIILIMYGVAAGAEFFSFAHPEDVEVWRGYMPPQGIHWFDNGSFRPHVIGVSGARDPETFRPIFVNDPEIKTPVHFFGHGFEYKFLGFIKTDRHLITIAPNEERPSIFLLGTDMLGRDMWSRLMFATRVSMSIGLTGVLLALVLGITFGGISGYCGGWVDIVIQRVIEILASIPTLPLWLGLAAAVPRNWSIFQIYFTITLVISLFAWTNMAREVRGRFLAMREEEFVMSARLSGSTQTRIIFRHMVPSFLSHIITVLTLSIPGMILAETALSFLGLGLRSPAISYGVLLKSAQNIQSIAIYPWMMIPALAVVFAVLAFNFVGDGLRDAADPYG